MNMGPVHNRPRAAMGPDQNNTEGCGAATHEFAEQANDRPDNWHCRLAELADQALRDQPDRDTSPSLRLSKLDEVRSRIASGFYASPETKTAIAEKLFDSLDL